MKNQVLIILIIFLVSIKGQQQSANIANPINSQEAVKLNENNNSQKVQTQKRPQVVDTKIPNNSQKLQTQKIPQVVNTVETNNNQTVSTQKGPQNVVNTTETNNNQKVPTQKGPQVIDVKEPNNQKAQTQKIPQKIIDTNEGNNDQKLQTPNSPQYKVQYTQQYDGALSKTQQKRQDELKTMNQYKMSQNPYDLQQYTFEIQSQQQFYIHLPIDQTIIIATNCYVEQQNHYKQISDIDKQFPLKLQILQGQYNILVERLFYFTTYAQVNGTSKEKYIIRFKNQGNRKLVAMQMKQIASKKKIIDKVSTEQVGHFAPKIKDFIEQFQNALGQFRRYWMYDFARMKNLAQITEKYYIYQLIEMVLTIILVLVQTKLIIKALKSQSVV